jgi:putative two-component system response regulator
MLTDTGLASEYENEIHSHFHDNLTSLFNHGFFRVSLERELMRSERHGEALALGLIDVDLFERYNQRHNPVEADRLLKQIADIVLDQIRQVDLAARYSGDVIAVALSKCDKESALIPMERIRQHIEELTGGDPTVSIGLASCPEDANSTEGLLTKAQEALLQAKIRGRNRVHCLEAGGGQREEEVRPRILAVDDDPRNLKLLKALLQAEYEIVTASSGADALSISRKIDLDLVLLDIMMPGMDGFEVCRRLKHSEATRLIPIVMVTAFDDSEAKVRAIEAGADDFLTKPPNKTELLARVKSLTRVKRLNNSLTTIENVLISLAKVVEAKDAYTQGHILRVANLALALGRRMGLPESEIEALRIGGILHDIGKIGVSAQILNKPGPLNDEEWEAMKGHPDAGYEICLPLAHNLGKALNIIRHHHERIDGSGYPDGLKGDEIAVTARIMNVVDIYDALTSNRPYRKAMSTEKATGILKEEVAQGKLDDEIVAHLITMLGRSEGEPKD